MKMRVTILVLLFCSFFTACKQASKDYWTKLPNPIGWVNDFENIFTEDQEKALDSLIAEYERKTTTEISVITIPKNATNNSRFDELTLLIAKNWAVGKKKKNNGILITISKGHQKIRIQNGVEIEKIITDSQTKQIIEKIFIPNFKSENFFEGVFNGIQEIKMVLGEGIKSDLISLKDYSVFQFIELLKIDKKSPINSIFSQLVCKCQKIG